MMIKKKQNRKKNVEEISPKKKKNKNKCNIKEKNTKIMKKS